MAHGPASFTVSRDPVVCGQDNAEDRTRPVAVQGATACRLAVLVVSCGIGLWLSAAAGQSAPARPAGGRAAVPFTDAVVRSAMARAANYLYSRQDAQGAFPNRHSGEYVGGGEALVALALLTAGEPASDKRVQRVLSYLKALQPGRTYTRCLRTMLFSLLPDQEYRKVLAEDARWLLKEQQRSGGWGYGPRSAMTRLRPEWTDASNSQFALLALREAAQAGTPVPLQSWARAENYWRRFQNRDGGWGYQPRIGSNPPQRPDSHGSMTAAGLASFLIFADSIGPMREERFEPGKARRDGELAFANEIHRALAWLKDNYAVDHVPRYVWMVQPGQLYYYLFCLLRVGDGAGLRSIGDNDYAREIPELLLRQQQPNGSWNNSVIDTSFALLCLGKARAPIVMNRLVLARAPGRDPRDAANVAKWLSRELGAPATWQQFQPNSPQALSDSPLLYVNAPRRAKLPQALARAFESFIRNGGTCLVQARPGDRDFVESFQQYCLGLFPDYEKQEIAAGHPVFSSRYDIKARHRPRLFGVGDRCRTRIFILADDVSGAWHQGRFRQYRHLFELAGNIVFYAAGGGTPPGRLAARARPAPAPPARRSIAVARLKYEGDYHVCPLAVPRLSDALAHSLSIGLKELPPADPARRIDAAIAVLWLTGNVPPRFSEAQQANIREYLETGGTLLIDPAIGRAEFRDAALGLLGKMFGRGSVKPVPAGSPLITGSFAGGIGADLTKVRFARLPATRGATQPAAPKLWAVAVNGRTAVVVSAYGLSCSIEGNPCYENVGYSTQDARKLALNVILYAATTSSSRPTRAAHP